MSEHIQQIRRVTNGGVSSETTRVVENDAAGSEAGSDQVSITARVIWFIAGVLLVLLAFRFVFVLLGANSANGFAHFIYSVSYPFARPFFGLFSYTVKYGVSRVELSTLVAMVVYALIAYGIVRLITIRQPHNSQLE